MSFTEKHLITFEATNAAEYRQGMKKLSSQQTGCWVGMVVFGMAYAKSYPSSNTIPYIIIGDCPLGCRAYWEHGKQYPFPQRLLVAYGNSCLGQE